MRDATLPATAATHALPKAVRFVAHPAWAAARRRILAAASEGPTTLALLGPAGIGKTWLLRHLADDLSQCGHCVISLSQGDLPWEVQPGTVLLIDEAARMSAPALARAAAQERSLVVLADLPTFAARLKLVSPSPVIVNFPVLGPDETRRFASAWLERTGPLSVTVSEGAVDRLVAHAQGTPRLIVQLLTAALALADAPGRTQIEASDIDTVARLRLGDLDPGAAAQEAAVVAAMEIPAEVPELAHEVAVRRKPGRVGRVAAGLSALAACAALAWLAWEQHQPASSVIAGSPVLAPRVDPEPAVDAGPVAEPAVPPAAAWASAPVPLRSPLPEPAGEVVDVPSGDPAPVAAASAGSFNPSSRSQGGPGLVLVARPGDTMRSLYQSIYQGQEPPPFDDVVAANPRPFRPGMLVVFPAPPGGWSQPVTSGRG